MWYSYLFSCDILIFSYDILIYGGIQGAYTQCCGQILYPNARGALKNTKYSEHMLISNREFVDWYKNPFPISRTLKTIVLPVIAKNNNLVGGLFWRTRQYVPAELSNS